MHDYQRWGGVAALIEAATFVAGFVILLVVLIPAGYEIGDVDANEAVAFLADNQTIIYIWTLIIYVVFGVALVVLSLALYDRLKAGPAPIVQSGTAFGLIWATLVIVSGFLRIIDTGVVVDLYGSDPTQSESVWLALNAVEEASGGGIELVGGLFLLLMSWAALRSRGLPTAMNYLGAVIGIAGVLTVVPALGEVLGAVFGLGLIVWFLWLGIVMLRNNPDAAA